MSTPADLSRPLPTAATERREEKLVESKGVEPLPVQALAADGAAETGAAGEPPSAPTPAELIATLRRLSDRSGKDDPGQPAGWYCAGCQRMHSRCGCSELVWDLLPSIIDTLAAAADRAEKAELERDQLQSKVDDTDGRIAAMEIHGNSADHWYRKATAYKDAFRVRDEAVKRAEKAEAELASERQWRAQVLSDIEDACRETECPVGVRFADWIRRLGALRVPSLSLDHWARKKRPMDEAELANAKWRHETAQADAANMARLATAPMASQDLVEQFQSAAAPNIRIEIRVKGQG